MGNNQLLMGRKSLQIFVAVGILALIIGFTPFAQAQLAPEISIQGQVTIEGANCGLTSPTASISYNGATGSLNNDEESGEHLVNFENNGNTLGNVFVRGKNWEDTQTQTVVMNVGDTRYGTQGTAYLSKTSLTESNVLLLGVGGGFGSHVTFQLKPNLLNPAYSGDAVQTVIFSIIC